MIEMKHTRCLTVGVGLGLGVARFGGSIGALAVLAALTLGAGCGRSALFNPSDGGVIGGSIATGGAPGTGGKSATGGAYGTGGITATGGAYGTGGISATGGSAGPDKALVTAWCANIKKCHPFSFGLFYDDDASCVTFEMEALTYSLQTPDIGATASNAQKCLAARAQASCDSIALWLPIPECADVPGKRPSGSPCYSGDQCASLTCEWMDQFSACGTCSTRGKTGDSCFDASECEGDLRCVDYTCVKPQVAGGACALHLDCGGLLTCVSGKCTAPLALGQRCSSTDQCGLEASCVAGTCQQDSLVGLGADCGPRLDGSWAQCSGLGLCSGGRCVRPLSTGQRCYENGPSCAGSARCVNGVCKIFEPSQCSTAGRSDGGIGKADAASGKRDGGVVIVDAATRTDGRF